MPQAPQIAIIGAGLGGLVWSDVADVLRRAGDDSALELVAVSLPT